MDEKFLEDVVLALRQGKISVEELQELLNKRPDKQMQTCVDLIHTLFCRKPHAADDSDTVSSCVCYYYKESILENTWKLSEHLKWINATQLLLSVDSSTPMQMQKDLRAICAMMKDTWDGKPRSPLVVVLYFFINFIGEDDKFFKLTKDFMEVVR